MHTPFRASLLAVAVTSLMGFAGAASAQVTDIQGDPAQSGVGECISNGTGLPPECVPAETAPSAAVTPSAPAAEAEVSPEVSPVAAFETPQAVKVAEYPAESGFVVDITGDVARSGVGDCIHSGSGAVPAGVTECGGESFAQFAVPMEEAPPAAQVQPEEPMPPPMRRITLDTDTTFGFDSADLTDQGKAQLDEIVDAAEEAERLRIHVTGYADRIGTQEYNLDLSQRRADSVKEYLASKGLPSDVISIEGRGESNPIVQCEGVKGDALIECLQPNRRSEVEFAALEPVPEEEIEPTQ